MESADISTHTNISAIPPNALARFGCSELWRHVAYIQIRAQPIVISAVRKHDYLWKMQCVCAIEQRE